MRVFLLQCVALYSAVPSPQMEPSHRLTTLVCTLAIQNATTSSMAKERMSRSRLPLLTLPLRALLPRKFTSIERETWLLVYTCMLYVALEQRVRCPDYLCFLVFIYLPIKFTYQNTTQYLGSKKRLPLCYFYQHIYPCVTFTTSFTIMLPLPPPLSSCYNYHLHCHHVTFTTSFIIMLPLSSCYLVGVVVQWLDYLAVTQEPGVRFPASAEKCHLMWRCPSGHGINYAWRRVLQTWQCGPTATLTQW